MKPTRARYFIETFLKRKLDELRAASGSARCINIGCGITGRYAQWLDGLDVDGIDVQTATAPQPWRYHQGDAAALPFPDQSFDAALAIEAFEHIDHNRKAMAEAFRVLKTGGKLILTVPTHYTWIFEFGRHGPHYYSREAIRKLISDAGFEVLEIRAGGGLIFYLAHLLKSWSSPIGVRLFGRVNWWRLIDGFMWPFYTVSLLLDKLLPVFPCNWLVTAVKR